jgi:fermentation-respiration switch protein FrsA (DUF1100 family)
LIIDLKIPKLVGKTMEIRDLIFEVDQLKIIGQLYLPGNEGLFPVVIICHGIPSGIPKDPGDGGYPALAAKICNSGLAAITFCFRGTGTSEGDFDIMGWSRDLSGVIDFVWLQADLDRSRIALLGFSAGGAVAICVGAQEKSVVAVAACASPADFDSLVSNPEESIKYFRKIGIIKNKDFPEFDGDWADNFKIVDPLYYVSEVSPRPFLLVHGDKDDVVNVEHARKLYEKAGEPKKLVILKDAGHRLRKDDRAVKIVIDWLKEVLTK